MPIDYIRLSKIKSLLTTFTIYVEKNAICSCSFKLSNVIQTLCESTVSEDNSKGRIGLGVSYADVIAILKKMSEKGAIDAEFHAGALPKININIKK